MMQRDRKPSTPRLISPPVGAAILITMLIIAFGLRLWNINTPSIWHDEGWSIRAIRDPIGTPDDKTPLVYYSLIHLLWNGAGESPLALRYGSVLLDVLTIALAIRLTRKWATLEAAILVAVLLSFSPLLWAYAREIRAYAAVPTLTVILLGGAERLLANPLPSRYFWRGWGVVLVAELLLLYTHNLSVPVVAWLNIVVGGTWLVQQRWSVLLRWLGAQAVLLIAYLPWLLSQPRSGTPINSPPQPGLPLIADIWQGYFAPLPRMVGAETPLVMGSWAFAVLALLSLAAIVAWQWNLRTKIVISQALLLPVLVTGELLVAHIDFHPRYYIVCVPATMMVIAIGIDSIREADTRLVMNMIGLALASGVGLTGIVLLLDNSKYQHDDFHAMATYYATLPEDAVILIPYGWEPAIEEYYADKLSIRAEILGIDLHSSTDEARAEINEALVKRTSPVHVELMTWYQLPADLRGMYSCLLAAVAQIDNYSVTVQGITTTAYQVEHPLDLVEIPVETVDYGAIHLTGATAAGQQAVCVSTEWTLPATTIDDWRVSARLLTTDPPGWVLARSDTDIRADDQTPTSMWKSGARGAGFSLLRFPVGASPVDYEIQLVVFSSRIPNGLDRLVNGIPSGKLLQLTTLQPQHTTDYIQSQPAQGIVSSTPLIELTAHDATDQTLKAGQELRITLHWRAPVDCCATTPWTKAALVLQSTDWEISQPVSVYSTTSLDWHALRIPAEASGEARLLIESDEGSFPLAVYTIEQTDRLFAPPAFDIPMQTAFAGLTLLEGFSVPQTTITNGEAFDLTLIWHVTHTTHTSYRVFTHLLNTDNRVIAQLDSFPVNGERPTTSWVPDEYIEDTYQLVFDPEFANYHGPAHLEVGFYDPDTSERLRVANGANHVILPIEITVQ